MAFFTLHIYIITRAQDAFQTHENHIKGRFADTKNNNTNPLKNKHMSKISLHSTTDPRDITKVLRDIHAENCFDTDVVGDIF